MEQFIEETRYPNLIKFSNQQPETVKNYIKHFNTEEDATKNLQHKMKVAFHNVKGKKKRGPGLGVNLDSLFAAAKAEDTIVTESWNTLGTSVKTISLQLRERSEVITYFNSVLLSFQMLIVLNRVIYNLIIWNLRIRQRKKPCQMKT